MLAVLTYLLLTASFSSAHNTGKGILFSSNVHIKSALQLENRIAKLLSDYVVQQSQPGADGQEQLGKLTSVSEFHFSQSKDALDNFENFIRNPINSFLTIKRLAINLRNSLKFVKGNDQLAKQLREAKDLLPDKTDLKGTVMGLNRLQDFYFLNFSNVSKGNMLDDSSPKLSFEDCFLMGEICFEKEDVYHSSMWMTAALETLEVSRKKNSKVDVANKLDSQAIDVIMYLVKSYYALSNYTKVLSLLDKALEIEPEHIGAKGSKDFLTGAMKDGSLTKRPTMDTLPEFHLNREGYRKYEDFLKFTEICRGNIKKEKTNEKHLSLLQCKISHKNNPRLLLAPVKEEILSVDPWVVLFHDIVTDNEVDVIQRTASEQMLLLDPQNDLKFYISKNTRIAKNAWLWQDSSPLLVRKVDERISDITGLSLSSAEPLQVANYGVGGHYVPHFDNTLDKRNKSKTYDITGKLDRIATFMIYLSDVREGGATVFLKTGIRVKPVKKTAVFWYNVHKNGERDDRNWHGACPVLLGDKWVANKWFHEKGQEFRRPCGKSQEY